MRTDTIFWRRLDACGLERLHLEIGAEGVVARSCLILTDTGGLQVDYVWRLTPDWRTTALDIRRRGPDGAGRIVLERADGGWIVDGRPRPDLDGTDEPDLSLTPFCNTIPVRRLRSEGQAARTLDVCYVDGATLAVVRSRQTYEVLTPCSVRYRDRGVAAGFEADLIVDAEGLVERYPPLFERLRSGP